MIIGVCGAPFTGKSKLSTELAGKLEYALQQFDCQVFYKEKGLETESVNNIIERLNVQSEIINTMCLRMSEITEDNIIFDSTPLDAFSYLMADFSSQNVYAFNANPRISNFIHQVITGMKQEIFRTMMLKFEFLIVCQPKLVTKRANDKSGFNEDYKMHIASITNGILATLPLNSIFLSSENQSFEQQVEFVLEHIKKISNTQKKKLMENNITVN